MRKAQAKKLPLAPDPKFNDKLVTRFVMSHMRHSYEEARPSGLPRVDGPMVLVDGLIAVVERGWSASTLDCRSDDVEVADGDQ